MQRVALLIIIFVFSALIQSELIQSATAQEGSASVPAAGEEDDLDLQSEEEEAEEEADEEETVVDDEYYQDADDKDFRPSEDIPADQSIPFPTDI